MKNLKKLTIICAFVILMSGCTTKKDMTTGDAGSMSGDHAPISGFSNDNNDNSVDSDNLNNLNGPAKGTQQDLVVNVGDRVFFDYDQYDLRAAALGTVEKQARWLKEYGNLNVLIEGHCDERGTREYNLALGEKRAMAVRNYLVALGVSPERIETISYGKERPTALGSNSSAWSQNRRGVVIIK